LKNEQLQFFYICSVIQIVHINPGQPFAMQREIHQWYSPRLNKDMEIAVYGHYGFALLMFPTAAADYLEYERFQLLDALAPWINAGNIKVFSINSINSEAWLNNRMHPRHKAIRHQQYNGYVEQEVVPFIHTFTSADTPIITTGASLGALHAANMFFRRPDLFAGTIAMSGVYDLTTYTKGYYDEDVYFNSPCHYLPNLSDEDTLSRLRGSGHIHILAGSGDYEDPDASRRLAGILASKGIGFDLDIWGHDIRHDWPTWRMMLPYVIDKKF
jgi:esterase/lipase superfamily enzyme